MLKGRGKIEKKQSREKEERKVYMEEHGETRRREPTITQTLKLNFLTQKPSIYTQGNTGATGQRLQERPAGEHCGRTHRSAAPSAFLQFRGGPRAPGAEGHPALLCAPHSLPFSRSLLVRLRESS